ncbi:hypothetical protein NEMIN01_0765 [Nematocida minor]|uniref:uncharacterized protein n=1 Tax=Nematocida minor TaxID=1912983 RepID=UPI00222006A8|nr:uncharacterized protein NEMIN01_0765 [Nematocida minor]KAI5189902.1 hypothetical protein NEMIN01_0765 [Nematocida minor]
MFKSEWLSRKLADGLNACLTDMPAADNNAVFGAITAYFFGLINPHFSNRFFIREVFNMVMGVVVLSSIYNMHNFLLILSGAPLNLVLSYVPAKNKKTRTKMFLIFNLLYVLVAYAVYDTKDTNPFLTISAFFMKYIYISMEYVPRSNGFMGYFGYIFFVPGIRYGPVMSYSAYDRWLNAGYMYLAETCEKKEITEFIGNTTDPKTIEDRKEDFVMHRYSKLITNSVGNFVSSIAFIIAYRQVESVFMNASRALTGQMGYSFELPIFYMYRLFYIGALWASEQAVYQIGFIDNMKNVKISPFLAFWKNQDLFGRWNIQGHKFMHRLVSYLSEKDKKHDGKETKEEKKAENDLSQKPFDLKEHIKISLLSYTHLLFFPAHFGSVFLSLVLVFIMGFVKEMPVAMGSNETYRFIELLGVWIGRLFVFSYFLLPAVSSPRETLWIWRKALAYGHFACVSGIVEKVLEEKNRSLQDSEIKVVPAEEISSTKEKTEKKKDTRKTVEKTTEKAETSA